MNDLDFLRYLNNEFYDVSLDKAIRILETAKTVEIPGMRFDFSTVQGRASFAESLPEVVSFMRDNKKIQAIKELRAALSNMGAGEYCSLKQTKDSIDSIYDKYASCPVDAPMSRW